MEQALPKVTLQVCVCVVGEQEGQTLGLLTIKTFSYSQMFIEHLL